MRNFFICLCFFVMFQSCENDLDLIGDRVVAPIVYGALNNVEAYNYIRLEKAFADNTISPIKIAQNPDSLYFSEAKVTIEEVGTTNIYILEKIDGTTIGLPKKSGIFANVPNFVYAIDTFQFKPKLDARYKLVVEINGKTYTASTRISKAPRISDPTPSSQFVLVPEAPGNTTSLPTVRYVNTSGKYDSTIINLYVRLNFREKNITKNVDFVDKSITIPVITNEPESESKKLIFSGAQFYRALSDSLKSDDKFIRQAYNIDFLILRGGYEYIKYSSLIAASAGITGTSDFPSFSNLQDGYGIFTNKMQTVTKGINLSKRSTDSLELSSITKNLGFQ